MLTVGTVLKNSYRIEKHLSSGGFGNTYLATIIEFDEVVAIKEFFISGVTERDSNSNTISVSNSTNQLFFEGQLNKFKKEARRLRKLKHSNIVGVHDLFEENGTAYYVMDYIDGESLSARIKRTNAPIGEYDAMNYFNQILDALEAVHNMGIWHLDLKPGNIMLDKNGCIKLIDFGASKQQSSSDGSMTTSSAVAYTNGFAPREQMEQNIDKFGPWTDIYALGATLYCLLTTYGPPLPTDIDDDETPDKSRALPMPYVSEKVKSLILWMMQTNRNKRPQSIAQVRAFINRNAEPLTYISPVININSKESSQSNQVSNKQPEIEIQEIEDKNDAIPATSQLLDDGADDKGKKKNPRLFVIIALSACLGIAAIWGARTLFSSSDIVEEASSAVKTDTITQDSMSVDKSLPIVADNPVQNAIANKDKANQETTYGLKAEKNKTVVVNNKEKEGAKKKAVEEEKKIVEEEAKKKEEEEKMKEQQEKNIDDPRPPVSEREWNQQRRRERNQPQLPPPPPSRKEQKQRHFEDADL